jgi:hypothetical protein
MKTEVILNQYDGPRKAHKALPAAQFTLDYANSDNAKEIDLGIRETIKGIRLGILAMGIALARMKKAGLFAGLGYHSMNDYIEQLGEDNGMDRSSIFNWLYIGEAYLKYQDDLEKIGFSDTHGPTKLPYLERALAAHNKREVFAKLKSMSLRAFISYARIDIAPKNVTPSKIRVIGNQIFVGDKLAVTLSKELDPKTAAYLISVNVEAGEALEAGEVILPVRLYDMDELRRFERAANKLKKDLRINYRGKQKAGK